MTSGRTAALSTLFLISLFGWLASPPARADFYLHHWEDQQSAPTKWKVWAAYQHYSSTENFDTAGAASPPTGLKSYTQNRIDLGASFGIGRKVSLYGRTTWQHAGVDSTAISGNSYGFGDQTVGANVRLIDMDRAGFAIDGQAQVDFAVYSNNSAALAGNPFLGDGSVDFSWGGFFTLPFYSETRFPIVQLTAGAGYTYRTDNFSSAIPWSVIARYAPQVSGLTASAGVAGIQTLQTDSRGRSGVALDPNPGRFTGGSLMANAINPSLMVATGSLGYQNDPSMSFSLAGSWALWGNSAPKGMSIGAFVTLLPKTEVAKVYGSPEHGFQSYSLEAKIRRVSDRLNIVQIDKGSDASVEKGQLFDIFRVRADGSIADAVAQAQATRVGLDGSDLTVTEYYKEVLIEEGFVAKRVVK